MKNRHGFKNFIKDRRKIEKIYENILKLTDDDSFLDELDHLIIALVDELGAKKEKKIKKLEKKVDKLRKSQYILRNTLK